jgi:hypothetical protein
MKVVNNLFLEHIRWTGIVIGLANAAYYVS